MTQHTFFCIDGHTGGAPVRLVAAGGPPLEGDSQIERREHFLAEYDWVRKALMFEPRGHDVMSGSILYPPTRDDCDIAVLFIETSGCLPMCGHGSIGTVTFAVERGLVEPETPGVLRMETPAGRVVAHYAQSGPKVTSVRIENVPAFLYCQDYELECPGIGLLKMDIAYGGNFYPIIEPQAGFEDLAAFSVGELLRIGRDIHHALDATLDPVHPQDPAIHGVRHCMWTGAPTLAGADARNVVVYGDSGIDRSPCGTGTCARMAQRVARGLLGKGESFVHESIIGSIFTGRVEGDATVGDYPAIVPSVEGAAHITGFNTLFVDDADPFPEGFRVG